MKMEEMNSHSAPTPTLSSLIDALHQMRDALTKASLLLQDLQFETDAPRRRSVSVESRKLMEKIKTR
jgi:hypothetical protein